MTTHEHEHEMAVQSNLNCYSPPKKDDTMNGPVDTPAHMPAPAITFARRVGIAAALVMAGQIAMYTLHLVSVGIVTYRLVPGIGTFALFVLNTGITAAVVAGIWAVMRQAQRAIDEGRRHWLAHLPEPRLIALLAGLLVLGRFAPHIVWDSTVYDASDTWSDTLPARLLLRLPGGVLAVVVCYAWIWWCDRPPRAERLLFVSTLAWVGLEFMLQMLDILAPTLNIVVSRTQEGTLAIPAPGTDAYLNVHLSSWIWRVGLDNFWRVLIPWLGGLVVTTAVEAAIALGLYRMLNRDPKPSTPQQ